VDRRRAAVVTGVQRNRQLDHLRTAELADHQPIRAHPQCLADQLAQPDRSGTLDVRRAGDETHHVRVVDHQLRGVFDHDQAILRGRGAEERTEQGGLARACASADRERQPGCDDRLQDLCDIGRHRAATHQTGQIVVLAGEYA